MASPAGPPFDDPTANIVICSSDNVAFRLHKIILSLASDFFKDMFSLPPPSPASSSESNLDGAPIVNVTEPSDVLERLFRLCYPVDDPVLGTIHDVRPTLEAALKYQMGEAIKITKKRLRTLASSDPLRVYAVACCFDLEAEAAAAAKEVLKQKAQGKYVAELEDLSIGAYHRLLSYCERGGRVSDRFRFTFHTSGGGRERPTPASTPSLAEAVLEPVIPDVLPEPQTAPYPFDLAEAEVTLVASDGLEFRVFKSILQLSSPVLFSKISDPSSPTPLHIFMSESSRILSILLQICYPVPDPRLSDLHDISAALVAAEKYEMEHARQTLRAAISTKQDDGQEDPVVLYATAYRFGMREVALAAARRTLRRDIMKSSICELDSLGVSGGCFYRLVDYHKRCRSAVQSLVMNLDWVDPEMAVQLQDACSMGYNSGSRLPCWYKPYVERVSQDEWPSGELATNEEVLQNVLESIQEPKGYPCTCETARGAFLLLKFSKCLGEAIRREEKRQALH